uniref:Haloacid dehalogenase-like hydrolase n=1 Tax=Marseillevirus LCMAC201 TaxID=2506605 RepID=A0A481YWX1_9VIRU|nr:MAG: haloacid dehalogenase-like hydrolase [Marseillevirus LCMAC201]
MLQLFCRSFSTNAVSSQIRRVRSVITDISGTIGDPLVKAPAVVFVDVFKKFGVPISMEEARKPMGNEKSLHIRRITEDPAVRERWTKRYGREPTRDDVTEMFNHFVPMQLDALNTYGVPIRGAVYACQQLKAMDIYLGLTTGFNREMVDRFLLRNPELAQLLDVTVAADETVRPRPTQHMINRNVELIQALDLEKPDLSNLDLVVKIDDTEMGILEAVNAGCWSIGLSRYSNLMGNFTNDVDQFEKDDPQKYNHCLIQIANQLYHVGADYVVDDITKVPKIIENINRKLAIGLDPPRRSRK